MNKKVKNFSENKIIFICWLAYTSAYIGRLNYNAVLVAIVSDLSVSKVQAGTVSSFFFFAYGVGQLINGILSKKYNAKIMVFLSLFLSAVLNLIMPLCGNIATMKYVWLLNGAVQSVLWSTLIKTLSEYISDKKLPGAIVTMSTTVAIGTFIAYGLSSAFVKLGSWQAIFFAGAAILAVSSITWLILFPKAPKSVILPLKINEKSRINRTALFALLLAALAGIANGFVKDGMNTWVPSVLYEEYGVSQSFSILLTLMLPLVSTLGATIAKKIHDKIPSHATMNLIFFLGSAILCGGILFSLKAQSLSIAMLCFVGIACGMSMINNVITSMFALDYRAVMNAGFAAGLLNTFCYIGSTAASYGLGKIAQSSGWNSVFSLMLTVCVSAAVICFAGAISERKIQQRN